MSIKFITDKKEQNELLKSSQYYIGEYYETITVEVHLYGKYAEIYSKFGKNMSDTVPHIAKYSGCQLTLLKSLEKSVIAGEMLIPKTTLNEMHYILASREPIGLQNIKGKFYIRANDIKYFKNIKLINMPFHQRRNYLKRVLEQLQSPYIQEFKWYENKEIPLTDEMMNFLNDFTAGGNCDRLDNYPSLYDSYMQDSEYLDFKGFYEYLAVRGNRKGVILKNKDTVYDDDCLVISVVKRI